MATFSNQGNSVDTYLQNSAANTNYGTSTLLLVGNDGGANTQRFLIKWDLSSIPVNAVVSSAVLSLYVVADYSNNARTIRAYRTLRAWSESQATWNVYSTGNNWGTAGCANTTNDREATDIGNATQPAQPAIGTEIAITLTASKVQEWIDGTLANNGLLVKVDTESADSMWYGTSANETAGYRPKLVISYTVPGGPRFINFI